jgi:arylsulfatase I/J
LSAKAVDVIENHAKLHSQQPMFMYLALHNTHGPVQAPEEFKALYTYDLDKRNTFDAMVSVVDSTVKNVTSALKASGMWKNTLFVWTTDNGSPCQVAGSNAPLRGNKGSGWEGGTRVPAFVNGGLLPDGVRGKKLDGIVAIWDYFATFLHLAHVDPTEPNKESPTPVDSYNMWPYFSGTACSSPRTEIVFDHLMFDQAEIGACIDQKKTENITQIMPCSGTGSLRVGDYKLMVGTFGYAGHYGHFSPNASWNPNMMHLSLCSIARPCLFNVTADMAEHNDLAEEHPAVVERLLKQFHAYDDEYHPPSQGPDPRDEEYCNAALHNGGFATYGWGQSRIDEEVVV